MCNVMGARRGGICHTTLVPITTSVVAGPGRLESSAEANHWQLCNHIESDPFLDTQWFEAVLEQLHVQAYPQAATRPPRLIAGDLPSIFET